MANYFANPINQMSQEDLDEEECAICMESLYNRDPVEINNCHHIFHRSCLQDNCANLALNNTLQRCKCPTCRGEFNFNTGLTNLIPQVQDRRQRLEDERRIAAEAERKRREGEAQQRQSALNQRMDERAIREEVLAYGRALPRTDEGRPIIPPGANSLFVYIRRIGTRNLQVFSRLNIDDLLQERANYNCLIQLIAKYGYDDCSNRTHPSPEIITQEVMRGLYNDLQYFEIERIREIIENLQRAADNITSKALHDVKRQHNFTIPSGPKSAWDDEFGRRREAANSALSPIGFTRLTGANPSINPCFGWGVNNGPYWGSIMPAIEETLRCAITIIENYLRQRQQDDGQGVEVEAAAVVPRAEVQQDRAEVSFGDIYCGQIIPRYDLMHPNWSPEKLQQYLNDYKSHFLKTFLGCQAFRFPRSPPRQPLPAVISQLDIQQLLQNPVNYDCILQLMRKYVQSPSLDEQKVMRELYDRLQRMRMPEIRDYIELMQRALDSINEDAMRGLVERSPPQIGGLSLWWMQMQALYGPAASVIPVGFERLLEGNTQLAKYNSPGGPLSDSNPVVVIPIIRDYLRCAITIIENYVRHREQSDILSESRLGGVGEAMSRAGAMPEEAKGGGQSYSKRGGRKSRKSRKQRKSKKSKRKQRKTRKQH